MNTIDSLAESCRPLRRIADSYAQAQQARVRAGKRICAAVEANGGSAEGEDAACRSVLETIRDGESDGPVPPLGRVYRHYCRREAELAKMLEEQLRQHPAWPWLRRLRGVGAVVLGELCGRLDANRADTPSAFWAYCGLGTVPGVEYHCTTCGLSGTYPVHAAVPEPHAPPGATEPCPGRLRPARGPEAGVRVAQPKPGQGGRPAYDAKAKQLCYLVGTSLLRSGGRYAAYYQTVRARLDQTRPDWSPDRKHMNALRKTEKLFLIQLWIVWREALGLPITQPYVHDEEHSRWTDPWEMVATPQRRRYSRSEAAPTARHSPA